MNRGRFFVLLTLITILFQLPCCCQPFNNKPIKTITVADGLPQSFICGFSQDSTGFMWIATRGGLARYDGKKFKIFNHIPDVNESLSSDIISFLFADNENNLWLFYETGDIDILNTRSEIIQHISKNDVFKQYSNLISWYKDDICEDKSGNVWIKTRDGNTCIYNLKKNSIQFYRFTDFGLHDSITHITSYLDKIFLCTNNNFYITDVTKKIYFKLNYRSITKNKNDSSINVPLNLFVTRNKRLLVFDNEQSLTIYKENQTITQVSLPFRKNITGDITEDKKGNVYFGYGNEIYIVDTLNRIQPWKNNDNNLYGFKSFYFDKSDVLWAGTNGFGIKLFDIGLTHLQGVQYGTNFPSDVFENYLNVPRAIINKTFISNLSGYYFRWCNTNDGKVWLATTDKTPIDKNLSYFQNGKFVQRKWKYIDGNHNDNRIINALAQDDNGRLWGIDYNMQLMLFNSDNYTITNYPSIVQSFNNKTEFNVNSLIITGDDCWIATNSNGLCHYNINTKKYEQYKHSSVAGSLPSDELTSMVQDEKNKNILWIGSLSGGLICFNKEKRNCTFFTEQNGLPNNTVYGVLKDVAGMLWCSTNKGLFSFNPKTKNVIQTFTSNDGLSCDEYNRYHYIKLPDNRLAFGGIDGYTVFNPLTIQKDVFQPSIAITSILINNKPERFKNSISGAKTDVNCITKLELSYKENFITFEFAALEYNIPNKLHYRYKLDDVNSNWINSGNNNTAVYTNLLSGTYTFNVNATNTSGEWSRFIKQITVIIKPPFWQTWWFRTLCFILIAFGIFAFFRNRINNARNQERQKIAFEHEAAELKMQALRAQMNPHFIFNSLNSIKALIQDSKTREAIIYLTTFSKLIRNQLNSTQQKISLFEELETCRLYAKLESLRFGLNIQTEFIIDSNVDTHSVMIPPLIIQPFIENAIWHGILPKQHGRVTVSIKQKAEFVQCKIEDNGIGRAVAMKNKHNTFPAHEAKGMRLAEARLGLFYANEIQKNAIEIIDKKDSFDNALGTLIIINFKIEE